MPKFLIRKLDHGLSFNYFYEVKRRAYELIKFKDINHYVTAVVGERLHKGRNFIGSGQFRPINCLKKTNR